jgi:hypothetical protein
MKKNVSLSIPRPCAESWSNFTPTSEGGFCGSCQKTVVDFSRMSDQQILDYLEQKRGAHTCGRFRADQLKTYTLPEPNSIRPGFMLLRAGVLGLLLLLASRPAGSKDTEPAVPKIEMTQGSPYPYISLVTTPRADHLVKGVIRDEAGEPVPGANIFHKGTSHGTTADAEGRFAFPYKLKAGDVLTVSFLGFTSLDYVVPQNAPAELDIEISLSVEYMIMGELVSTTPYEETPDVDAPTPVAPRR